MKTISLRDFQREGARALGAAEPFEPWILAGRGQEFLLLPVPAGNRAAMIDLAEGLAAVMALREDQSRAVEAGLDRLTAAEIEAEIKTARKSARHGKRSA